tara:strand:+ start:851 stop:2452 length:1602 start_codon:yes stop_codon:yes gene_type:complete
MKKIKFKIKISTELTKLKNFFVDKFKKFTKFVKFKIIKSFNNYFTDQLNKFIKFIKLKHVKFIKISNLSISIILFITLSFIYLFYLSIPTLYNKDALQKDITNKLIKEFRINFSLSSNIKYVILPAPHVLIENVKIFNNNLKDPKELSQIKKLKIYISQKNLFDQNNLKINKILIEDANFLFQKKNYKFFDNYLKVQFPKKKIIIKNSNFFLKDKDDEIISIFPIKNINLLYDEEKLANQMSLKGKFFKIPFNLNWHKNFGENNKSVTLIKLKKLDLEMKNESFIEDKKYSSKINIFFRNTKLNSNFQIKNNLISFNSEDSKLVNNNLDYNGKIYLEPFDMKLEINLDKLNLIKLLTSSSAFLKASNLEFLFNKNLSAKININSKNIQNKLFDFSKIIINFDNGKINFDDSFFNSKKIGSLKLINSKIDSVDEKLIFKGSFDFDVTNQDKFYTAFQVPKKNRKLLKNIFFELQANILNDKLNINNFKINSKKSVLNDATKSIINQYNNSEKNKIHNWINLKNFIKEIFNSYSG